MYMNNISHREAIMMDILEGLNREQTEAVTTTEGHVRVIAGAGSGKTRALTHRFAYLTQELGVLPSNILCVTFTNKAAAEMRRRIRIMTGDSDTGLICTFHSFCVTVLQEEAYAVQYPNSFIVLDNSDIDSMLSIIYEEWGLTLRHMTFGNARDMIEMRKMKYEPHYYEDMIAMPLELLKEKYDRAEEPADIIFYGYLYQEKKCFALDYNDLIAFTLYIFSQNEEIKLKWQKRLEYIMIDEFQDIDKPQYKLMCTLCAYHGNLFVVGDPDQTIYTWRGADIKYLLEFDKVFPETKTIFLNKNYRSTPQILAAANSLISKNKTRVKKELIAVLPNGDVPVWQHCRSAVEEAEKIAKEIQLLTETKGAELRDAVILYRAHYVSRVLEEVFLKKQIPYYIYSGTQFYDRAETKDALSYLRFIAFLDDMSFKRIINRPKRNIGERRMKALTEYAEKEGCTLYTALKQNAESELFRSTGARKFIDLTEDYRRRYSGMPVSELLSELLNKSGYEEALRTEGSGERLDNLAELKQSVYEYETGCGEETTLESYLQHIALFTNTDALPDKNAVRMMTVHSAKGLEFPYVFIAGLCESIFPSKKTADIKGMEEERRLAFVAATRAQKGLYLTDSEGRDHSGSFRYPSRFILDIDKTVMEYRDPPDTRALEEAAEKSATNDILLNARAGDTEFVIGDRVAHSIMGEGVVTAIDDKNGAYTVKFDILPTERKISFRAKLKKSD